MSRSKVPPEAFEYYVGLGAERSYQAVAVHYGVSKRAIGKKASSGRWRERLEALLTGARVGAGERAAHMQEEVHVRQVTRVGRLQDALHEVISPQHMKAIVASLFKAAVQKDDVAAARFLVERLLGKPRNEPLPATAIDIPDGLRTAADVQRAANALLQGVTEGSLAPEDAQKAAMVLEAARRSVETQELAKRIEAIEENLRKERDTAAGGPPSWAIGDDDAAA